MKKTKLTMLRWLPASGKSTFANIEALKSNWNTKRINKDDIRGMIDAWKWSKSNEKNIIETRNILIGSYLSSWYNVIIDDTNFAPHHEETFKVIAHNHKATFIIKEFDTDVDTCIERDSKRDKPVGKKVITEMYHRYVCKEVIPNSKWKTVICDIDWTLAYMRWRSPYDYTQVHTDWVVMQVWAMIRLLRDAWYNITICTWRDWVCEKETKQRLKDNKIEWDDFYIRPVWDTRNDTIVKKEMLDKIWRDNVFAVFDDRQRVVRMRRAEWLYVFNVWSGREF